MTWAHLPNSVIAAWPKLSRAAGKVIVALGSFMDAKGRCFPSREAIGERAGITRLETITAALKEIEELGLVTVTKRRRQSKVYAWNQDLALSAISKNQDLALTVCQDLALSASHKNTTEVLTTTAKIPVELRDLELYAADAKLITRWPELRNAWARAYPGVDIATEVAKAHSWELANTGRRKRDHARFLNGWLSRAKPVESDEDDYELSAEQIAFARQRLTERSATK